MNQLDPAYYRMKRTAQQTLAHGWNVNALLLMDDLRAWWHCTDKKHEPARSILKSCRRLHHRLTSVPADSPELAAATDSETTRRAAEHHR